MPRANRSNLPGQVWHITHRCHKREFLLKFKKDRDCWLRWTFEARKRYGLCVLNYFVTSNHIHLLVKDAALTRGQIAREPAWSDSLAVGAAAYVEFVEAACADTAGDENGGEKNALSVE